MEGFSFRRAVIEGVVLGAVAAGLFFLFYQAVLHSIYREVANGLATGADAKPTMGPRRESDNGAGPDVGNDAGGDYGLGGERFGDAGSGESIE